MIQHILVHVRTLVGACIVDACADTHQQYSHALLPCKIYTNHPTREEQNHSPYLGCLILTILGLGVSNIGFEHKLHIGYILIRKILTSYKQVFSTKPRT